LLSIWYTGRKPKAFAAAAAAVAVAPVINNLSASTATSENTRDDATEHEYTSEDDETRVSGDAGEAGDAEPGDDDNAEASSDGDEDDETQVSGDAGEAGDAEASGVGESDSGEAEFNFNGTADTNEQVREPLFNFNCDTSSNCVLCSTGSDTISDSRFKQGDIVTCGRIQNRNYLTGLPSAFRERAVVMAVIKVGGLTTHCWSARVCKYHVKFEDGHCQTVKGVYLKVVDS